jgi:REP element-mobilizing transposase RayT
MGRRAVNAVYVHLVWATWDRLPLVTDVLQPLVYRAIGAACVELGAEGIALGGVEDHVHLVVHLPATVSVAELLKRVKGSSSHLVTHTPGHADILFKWQGAYGAASVSQDGLPAVATYIAHQREHHAAGSLNATWELPSPVAHRMPSDAP